MKAKLTFQFFKTRTEAENHCDNIFNKYSAYLKKKYGKPIPQFWFSKDDLPCWIVWFRG